MWSGTYIISLTFFADCVSLTLQDRGESFGAQLQADRSGKTFGPYKSLLVTS